MTNPKDFAAIAERYCRDVTEGRILVSKYVKLSCARHLDDLARQCTPEFPYRFSPDHTNRIGRFCEIFHVFEGPLAGQHIDLMEWQCFILSAFGWLCEGGERHGYRRFRRAYVEIPRGNSKTTFGALITLYCCFAEGEGGAQAVSAGTSRDVAKISHVAAQEMCRREPEFTEALGIEILAHSIIQKRTASRFNPIAADSKTSDGKNLHFCLFDEAWAFKTRALYDSLETGTGKRKNSMMFCIGTAGFDTASIAYELRSYLCKILDGMQIDDSSWGVVYSIPDGMEDKWADPIVLRAANPGYGRMVMPEILDQLAAKAAATPSAVNNFLVKHCNVWCSADAAWMDMTKWRAMSDPSLDIADFAGQQVVIGLDLATKSDIAGKTYIFRRTIEGETHYYLFATAYLPEAAVALSQNSQYRGWQQQNLLHVGQGDVTDFAMIEDELLADMATYEVQAVGFDPWHASQLAQRMMSEGVNMQEVRMNVSVLSEPMKEIDALIRQGRFHHNNPILDSHFANVTVQEDRNANIFPRKATPSTKIDLAVASIIAMALALEYPEQSAMTSLFMS